MKHDNIEKILKSDAHYRDNLLKLAAYGYKTGIGDPKLDLNVNQAEKYLQYQFIFDPKLGFQHYENDFQAVFSDEAESVFNELRAQHPFGVEIWVYPPSAKRHPLIENNASLAIDSLLSAAKLMLLENQHRQITDNVQPVDKINRKYESILATIKAAHAEAQDSINKLYALKDLDHQYLKQGNFKKWAARTRFRLGLGEDPTISPETKQYRQAEEKVIELQHFLVAQIAAFEMITNELPTHDAYTQTYKTLSKYEQRQKLEDFYKIKENKELKSDLEGNKFKRDIFTVDGIQEEGENNKTIKYANWHYHNRHYTMTEGQIALKTASEGLTENDVNPTHPQVTATSHSPVSDYSLPNSAIVQEGSYYKDNEVVVNFMNARHGSPSPNELYPESSAPRASRNEEPEATFRAYLNMEQHLQQLRTKIIAVIVTEIVSQNKNAEGKKILTVDEIEKFSRDLSYHLTKALSDQKLGLKDEAIDKQFILKLTKNALEKVVNQNERINEAQNMLNEKLTDDFVYSIINIKNIHTHLITATGIGSSLQSQRYHFHDSRVAQYATWSEKNDQGYIYMSNGVNGWRYDTLLFDTAQILSGNNAVAMVEIYKELASFDKDSNRVVALFKDESQLKNYNEKLEKVKEKAKAYILYLQQFYMPEKIKLDNFEKNIEHDKKLLKKLKSSSSENMRKKAHEIEEKLRVSAVSLKEMKKTLTSMAKVAKEKRNEFEKAEKELHIQAVSLNAELYAQLKNNATVIENLVADPNARRYYLAQKAFLLAEELTHETSYGMAEWKFDGNNGLLQTLIHLASEQMGLFASGGCKSANDRELLLAMLISEISLLIKQKSSLTKESLQMLHKQAQEAFAWHISRRQTGLDVSAIPKTGSDILKYAEIILKEYVKTKDSTGFSKYSSHQKFESLAAHKRIKGYKDIKHEKMKQLSIKNVQGWEYSALYNWWSNDHNDAKMALHDITKRLEAAVSAHEFTVKKSIVKTDNNLETTIEGDIEQIDGRKKLFNELLSTLQKWQKSFLRESHFEHPVKLLGWKTEGIIFELDAKKSSIQDGCVLEKTSQYIKLKSFFDSLKEKLNKNNIGGGEGLKSIKDILKKYDESKKSLHELVNFYMQMRSVSATRTEDWTKRANDWISIFTKFESSLRKKRTEWLQALYTNLQKDINLIELPSDELLKNKINL